MEHCVMFALVTILVSPHFPGVLMYVYVYVYVHVYVYVYVYVYVCVYKYYIIVFVGTSSWVYPKRVVFKGAASP